MVLGSTAPCHPDKLTEWTQQQVGYTGINEIKFMQGRPTTVAPNKILYCTLCKMRNQSPSQQEDMIQQIMTESCGYIWYIQSSQCRAWVFMGMVPRHTMHRPLGSTKARSVACITLYCESPLSSTAWWWDGRPWTCWCGAPRTLSTRRRYSVNAGYPSKLPVVAWDVWVDHENDVPYPEVSCFLPPLYAELD